jgi:TRAP transporter TAXI family solute receptor
VSPMAVSSPWRMSLAAGLCLAVMAAGCGAAPAAATTSTTVKLTTAFPNSAWQVVGQALAAAYTARVPHLVATATPSDNLEYQADALQGGSVDLALEDAETAYIAYSRGTVKLPEPHRRLRAIAVLFSTAVQIVVSADSGITRVADLRGRRIDVGARGGSIERSARLILESHGLSYDSVQAVFGSPEPAKQLQAGTLDARVFYAPFPHAPIAAISEAFRVTLIPVERQRIGAIQERHHFLKTTTIPAGTYAGQDRDLLTLGMDIVLLCREDLEEPLVYELTRTLFESVPDLVAAHAAARGIDPERGPTASIPLHPGAARYYRAREILK